MLKKFLSTIGIGSMKVDTVVDQPEIRIWRDTIWNDLH